jgi:hypothetical protein
MHLERLSRAVVVFVLLALALIAGCHHQRTDLMVPVKSPSALKPPPGRALVVFLRPHKYLGKLQFTIIDSRGRFLGESLYRVHFAVPMEPGTHMLFTWFGRAVDPLQANLAPNKTYFVMAYTYRAYKGRVAFRAFTPRTGDWYRLQEFLNMSERREVNFAAGQAYLQRVNVTGIITKGMKVWESMSLAKRVEHTLYPADGV